MTNVQIVDLDKDGLSDLVVCDAGRSCVYLYRQTRRGHWEERILAEDLTAPATVDVVDLDGDGDQDLIVSLLGDVFPSDEIIGRVILLEQQHGGRFVSRVLLDDVRRVADVRAGDLDGDGDLDLAVAVFGYSHGQVLWLENLGNGSFLDRELMAAPGAIHVPLADFDGDGDLDIATVISQNEEEIWAFENLGEREFRSRRLHYSPNYDIGSAGLVATDLDRDGDMDLLWPVGDNLEDRFSYPQPYHGCFWLENRGEWDFKAQRIARLGGTYAAAAGDLDGDGDQDVALVSMFNEWSKPGNASVVWLENDGQQRFRTWQVADRPTHLVTVDCGDLDGDGRDDIVAAPLHLRPPYDRRGRVTIWWSGGGPWR